MYAKGVSLTKSWRVATGSSLAVSMRVLRRGARQLGRQFRRRVIFPLTACCSAGTAPLRSYRRLYRTSKPKANTACSQLPSPNCGSDLMCLSSSSGLGQNVISDLSILEAEDTVVVKVGMVGDSGTGKTRLMSSYVSDDQEDEYAQTAGVSSREKICKLGNAQIAFSIWDLGGHRQFVHLLPLVCNDAAVILLVFDLTRRCTLHSVKHWFTQARLHNKTALPVLVGTKYDSFVALPYHIKALVTKQARLYAKAMGAVLFFSSTVHNINVNKIFKVVVAKLFDLPCNIPKNYTIGEPIIHY